MEFFNLVDIPDHSHSSACRLLSLQFIFVLADLLFLFWRVRADGEGRLFFKNRHWNVAMPNG